MALTGTDINSTLFANSDRQTLLSFNVWQNEIEEIIGYDQPQTDGINYTRDGGEPENIRTLQGDKQSGVGSSDEVNSENNDGSSPVSTRTVLDQREINVTFPNLTASCTETKSSIIVIISADDHMSEEPTIVRRSSETSDYAELNAQCEISTKPCGHNDISDKSTNIDHLTGVNNHYLHGLEEKSAAPSCAETHGIPNINTKDLSGKDDPSTGHEIIRERSEYSASPRPASTKTPSEYSTTQINSSERSMTIGVESYDSHEGAMGIQEGEEAPTLESVHNSLNSSVLRNMAAAEQEPLLLPRDQIVDIHCHVGPAGVKQTTPSVDIKKEKLVSAEAILQSDAGDRADKKFDDKISNMLNESVGNVVNSRFLTKQIKKRIEKIAERKLKILKPKKNLDKDVARLELNAEDPVVSDEEKFLAVLTQTTQYQEKTITGYIFHFYNLLTQRVTRKQGKGSPVTLAEYTQHLRMDDLIRSWKPTVEATRSLREWWHRKGCLQGKREKFELTLLMGDMCEKSKQTMAEWKIYRKEENIWLNHRQPQRRNEWIEEHINALLEFMTSLLLDIKTMMFVMHTNDIASEGGKDARRAIDKIIIEMPNKYVNQTQ